MVTIGTYLMNYVEANGAAIVTEMKETGKLSDESSFSTISFSHSSPLQSRRKRTEYEKDESFREAPARPALQSLDTLWEDGKRVGGIRARRPA